MSKNERMSYSGEKRPVNVAELMREQIRKLPQPFSSGQLRAALRKAHHDLSANSLGVNLRAMAERGELRRVGSGHDAHYTILELKGDKFGKKSRGRPRTGRVDKLGLTEIIRREVVNLPQPFTVRNLEEHLAQACPGSVKNQSHLRLSLRDMAKAGEFTIDHHSYTIRQLKEVEAPEMSEKERQYQELRGSMKIETSEVE